MLCATWLQLQGEPIRPIHQTTSLNLEPHPFIQLHETKIRSFTTYTINVSSVRTKTQSSAWTKDNFLGVNGAWEIDPKTVHFEHDL